LLSTIVLLVLSACTDESPLVPDDSLVMLRAYLFAGQPVTEIRLTAALPLGSEDSTAPTIDDAQVTLTKDGGRYLLEPTSGRPGFYHYAGSDLVVETGDEFGIEVAYYGKLATATTTVPPAPVQIGANPEELVVEPLGSGGFGFGRGFMDDTTAIQVTWQNDDGGSYYVALENVETDPEPIDDFSDDFPGGGQFERVRFVSIPVSNEEYRITGRSVTYYGRHLVTVYRVNPEYVDLFLTRNQDSRDLNEPLTNVAGGLGIFTAFNSDSTFIEVVSE